MARIAPFDPQPTTDTEFADKPYHWAWGKVKKTDPTRAKWKVVLHRGETKKCKRVHPNPAEEK